MADLVRLDQCLIPARLSAAFAISGQGQDMMPPADAAHRGALHPLQQVGVPGAMWSPMHNAQQQDRPPQPQPSTPHQWQGAFGYPQGYRAAPDAAAAAAAAQAAADCTVPQAPGAAFSARHPEAPAAGSKYVIPYLEKLSLDKAVHWPCAFPPPAPSAAKCYGSWGLYSSRTA